MGKQKWSTETYRIVKGAELLVRSAIGYEGRKVVDNMAKNMEKSYQEFIYNKTFDQNSHKFINSTRKEESKPISTNNETYDRVLMLGKSAKTFAQLGYQGIFPGTAGRRSDEILPIIPTNAGSRLKKQEEMTTPISTLNSYNDKTIQFTNNELPGILPQSKENTVPSSRMGRMTAFGYLAASMTMGAAAESIKRIFDFQNNIRYVSNIFKSMNPMGDTKPRSETKNDKVIDVVTNGRPAVDIPSRSPNNSAQAMIGDSQSSFLSDANAERLVRTLCRVRGAALKLGQMLSLQDEHIVSPRLHQILERVRKSADFMPDYQVNQMLAHELGDDWQNIFSEFNGKPFAAASIGQVHRGVLKENNKPVAIKIQYPGVADSINSDIDNLVSILKMTRIAPAGLFADDFINVVRRELQMECNYLLEAENMDRMRALFYDETNIHVPEPFSKFTTKRVLVNELVGGCTLEKCIELPQAERDWIGEHMLKVTLDELFLYRFMQTDPNWANFLYAKQNDASHLILLDFGAARDYSKKFVDMYLNIIKAAIENDRAATLEHSRTIGFLSGFESKTMNEAHVDAVMILGEALRSYDPFDFGTQDMTRRITKIIPVMLENRTKAPPKEIYSLHRKLSGVFLLAAKLKSRVACRPMFDEIYKNYNFCPDSDFYD